MLTRVVTSGTVGTALEWYGFILYGTMSALVLNQLFFPPGDPFTGTLASFATFAVGFAVRPLGGLVIGHYGDRLGRKRMLVLTLLLMGSVSALMGALPTYSQIGVWAPILLVVLRAVQGFGAGAEYAGAALTTAEFARPERRGLFTAIPPAGASLGALLSVGAVAAVSALPRADFLSWGWRIPFLASFLITATGLYIRSRVAESPVFEESQQTRGVARAPAVELVRESPRAFALGLLSSIGPNVAAYIPLVFALSYLAIQLKVPQSTVLTGVMLGYAASALTMPLFGRLSDTIGRKPVFAGGLLFGAAYAFPFFWLLETGETFWIWFAFVICGCTLGAQVGTQASFLTELFHTRTRYSGVALSRELAAALAGGTAPLVATALLGAGGGSPGFIALYMMALSLVSACAVFLAPGR
jgi:MFS family permease